MNAILHPQPQVLLRQPVNVYRTCNGSYGPSTLTDEQFLSFYLYLFFKVSGRDPKDLENKFPNIRFTIIADDTTYPDDLINIDPLLFYYYSSLIPKNATNSAANYQQNKAEGLVRTAEIYGYQILKSDYIIGSDALIYARRFLDNNRGFMSIVFAVYISSAMNERINASAAGYARETSLSVDYAYMVGVQMIEEILIAKHSLVLTHVNLQRPYKMYVAFKSVLKDNYKEAWSYAGLLAPNVWNTYKRETSFKQLWILSGALAEGEDQSYRNITIDGENIVSKSGSEFYKSIIRWYKNKVSNNGFAVPTDDHGARVVEQVNAHYSNWVGHDSIEDKSKVSRFENEN